VVGRRLGFAGFLVGDREITAPWTPCRIRVLFDVCARAIWVFCVCVGGGGRRFVVVIVVASGFDALRRERMQDGGKRWVEA